MDRGNRPPLALAYHGVAKVSLRDDPSLLFVPPDHVARHIRRLRRWGYELLPFSDLARRVSEGRAAGCAALTFDDGLVDNLEALAPVLQAEDAPATVFVSSGLLGRSHPYAPHTRLMTAEEVVKLRRTSVEIGAHTRTHVDLTELDYEAALAELRAGKADLEQLLDEPIQALAYPYGRATAETRAAAREAGFSAACRTCGEGDWSDPLDMPRQDMTNAATMVGLRLKRDERYEPLMRKLPFRAARSVRRRLLTTLSR